MLTDELRHALHQAIDSLEPSELASPANVQSYLCEAAIKSVEHIHANVATYIDMLVSEYCPGDTVWY